MHVCYSPFIIAILNWHLPGAAHNTIIYVSVIFPDENYDQASPASITFISVWVKCALREVCSIAACLVYSHILVPMVLAVILLASLQFGVAQYLQVVTSVDWLVCNLPGQLVCGLVWSGLAALPIILLHPMHCSWLRGSAVYVIVSSVCNFCCPEVII